MGRVAQLIKYCLQHANSGIHAILRVCTLVLVHLVKTLEFCLQSLMGKTGSTTNMYAQYHVHIFMCTCIVSVPTSSTLW